MIVTHRAIDTFQAFNLLPTAAIMAGDAPSELPVDHFQLSTNQLDAQTIGKRL
ncbi:hypothetical protein D3C77_786720 [compost metagenome]